jgi:hypothetical protein
LGKKKRRKKEPREVAEPQPSEDRRTEAVTAAWMLCTIVTLGALVLGGIVWLAMPLVASQAGEFGTMGVIPPLLLFVATVTGTVSIILMFCAMRFRRIPPPRSIIIASAVICLLPFGVRLLLEVW